MTRFFSPFYARYYPSARLVPWLKRSRMPPRHHHRRRAAWQRRQHGVMCLQAALLGLRNGLEAQLHEALRPEVAREPEDGTMWC